MIFSNFCFSFLQHSLPTSSLRLPARHLIHIFFSIKFQSEAGTGQSMNALWSMTRCQDHWLQPHNKSDTKSVIGVFYVFSAAAPLKNVSRSVARWRTTTYQSGCLWWATRLSRTYFVMHDKHHWLIVLKSKKRFQNAVKKMWRLLGNVDDDYGDLNFLCAVLGMILGLHRTHI